MKAGPLILAAAVVLVGGFVFGDLAAAVDRGARLGMDRQAFDVGADLRSGAMTSVMKVVTAVGSTTAIIVVLVAALAFLADRRCWLGFAPLLAGALLTNIAWNQVKTWEARPRPAGRLVAASGFSFPSGHATNSVAYVAVAVALAVCLPRLAGRAGVIVVAIVLAAAIGLSRVYLRVHYLSDVVGGWALGAALFSICALVALLVASVRHNVRSP